MLNLVWPFFIIISILYAVCFGNLNQLNNSIFESTTTTINLCLTLLGTISLWNGIMKIASETSFIKIVVKILRPIIKVLFPEIEEGSELYKQISMNMVANILGLGNAATPLGIKAMKIMKEESGNKDILTNDMAVFIVLNTASIQIIPTTVIAIRNSLNSENPTSIIFPVWIATISAAIAGITATKLFIKLGK